MADITGRLKYDIRKLQKDPIKQNIRHTQTFSALDALIRLCHQNNIAVDDVSNADWDSAIMTIRNVINNNKNCAISFWLND